MATKKVISNHVKHTEVDQWGQKDYTYANKVEQAAKKENSELKARYYFWDWCLPYGWRQMGNTSGYATEEECIQENQYSIKNSDNWKIMKAHVIGAKRKVEVELN